jgi:hypothetical protein
VNNYARGQRITLRKGLLNVTRRGNDEVSVGRCSDFLRGVRDHDDGKAERGALAKSFVK